MAYRPTQLSRLILISLLILFGLSFISGLGLWYVHEQREMMLDLPPWTALARAIHGILNPAICALLGYLWFNHVRGGWKMRANQASGACLAGALILLIGSGVGLYYSEHRHFYFTLHLIPGLLLPVFLTAHWARARKWVHRMEAAAGQKK